MGEKSTFIKLDRNILKWGWYTDSATLHLFIHLILTANIEDKKWKSVTVKRGQLVTSLSQLSQHTGLTIQQTRTALSHLNSTNEITQESTHRYTLITVVNYDFYQQQPTHKSTNKQHAINTQPTRYQQQLKKDISKDISKKDSANAESKKERKKEGAAAPKLSPQEWEREIPEEFWGEFESLEDFQRWWES